MARRGSGKLRSFGLAAAACLLAIVPVALLLRDDGPARPPAVTEAAPAGSSGDRTPHSAPAAPTPPSGVQLAPPPPGARPPRPVPQPPRPSSADAEEEQEEAGPPASVRLVALRKLERKRPAETVEGAEALVRDTADDPAERSVLISALGLLRRVPGGEDALLRLSDDPPTPEVGKLASDLLMRSR